MTVTVIYVLQLGDVAPNFTAQTTEGKINFYDWIGDSWCLLFSHPKDFTPVCTTELGLVAKMAPEFERRNCKIIGLSVDSIDDHNRWKEDIKDVQGTAVSYPMIGDDNLSVSKLYGMIHPNASGRAHARTAVDNATVRNCYIIDPDKEIKLIMSYPMSTGRNFDEILRVLDSCQLTANHQVATPVNWQQGEDVIIVPAVSNEDAKKKYPGGWKSPKPYLRIVPQPNVKPPVSGSPIERFSR